MHMCASFPASVFSQHNGKVSCNMTQLTQGERISGEHFEEFKFNIDNIGNVDGEFLNVSPIHIWREFNPIFEHIATYWGEELDNLRRILY